MRKGFCRKQKRAYNRIGPGVRHSPTRTQERLLVPHKQRSDWRERLSLPAHASQWHEPAQPGEPRERMRRTGSVMAYLIRPRIAHAVPPTPWPDEAHEPAPAHAPSPGAQAPGAAQLGPAGVPGARGGAGVALDGGAAVWALASVASTIKQRALRAMVRRSMDRIPFWKRN